MQSIFSSACRRERFRNSGESGGMVPRPMPFVNEGTCVSRMKRFISAEARDHLTLVPAISIGRRAARRSSRALRTSSRSGERRGGAVRMRGIDTLSGSTWPMKTSIGISRNAGPGMPETACRIASSMYSGMRAVW
jgi:hypothetical protein